MKNLIRALDWRMKIRLLIPGFALGATWQLRVIPLVRPLGEGRES